TFTNKASEEMKDRLVNELFLLKSGEKSTYLDFLSSSLKNSFSETTIRKQAGIALSNILHDYSRFMYMTIDSFFQKILRSFMREMNLNANYDLDLDSDGIINEIVDKLIDDTNSNNELLKWVTETAKAKMVESGRWDFRAELKDLYAELFKEKFEQVNEKYKTLQLNRDTINALIKEVNQKLNAHTKFRKYINASVLACMRNYNLSEQDFYYNGSGIISTIKRLNNGFEEPKSRFLGTLESEDKLLKKSFVSEAKSSIYQDLKQYFQEYIDYYNKNIEEINSLNLIKQQIYILGLIVDGRERMTAYLDENDRFFIGDTPLFLAKMINNNPTPFIYEKVGVFLKHYLIDEFQDTSSKQWEAFLPLIREAIDTGNFGMVVGDVKQAIYRWRNGDWKLLARTIHNDIETSTYSLANNWRSGKNIVHFNNSVFSQLAVKLQSLINTETGEGDTTIIDNYSDAIQTPQKPHQGYVNLNFLPKGKTEDSWEQVAMENVAENINTLLNKGHSAGDIAVLVRTNAQAAKITEFLLEYQNQNLENTLHKYQIVSSVSLSVASNPAVIIIVGIMTYIAQSENIAALYTAVINYNLHIAKNTNCFKNINVNTSAEELLKQLPQDLQELIQKKDFSDLVSLAEQIIETAGLNKNDANTAFIDNFLQVLSEFLLTKGLGLYAFIEKWNRDADGLFLQISEGSNAVKILSIHQSKGLGFPIVFMPFCDLDLRLNHKNIIWCNADKKLNTNIAFLPIKVKKDMEVSWFKNDYFEEKLNSYQDNLNLLYVAFTRAKDALYLYSPDVNSKIRLANYLKEIVSSATSPLKENCIDLSSYFNAEDLKLEIGTIPEPSEKVSAEKFEKTSHHVNLESRKAKLKGNFAKMQASGNIAKGILYHDIFELINHADDVNFAVNKIAHNYQLTTEEADNLKTEISSFINKEKVKYWFTDFDELHNENWIVSPSGNLHKPDRVMRFGNEFIVLDYKFGQELPRYKKQIKNYLELLNQMGHQNCTGYIWYVFENKLHKIEGAEVKEIEVE
ncbi:MAG: UvrD-helicase domain-containing protein, partial [Bacteroidales bacterium]|nr:UvrD-helicase domain-containing protein [Bacteroidales bacterium]